MSHLKLLKEQTAGDDDTIPNREDEVPDSRSSQWETALYAATNLESWETDEPHHYARDVRVAGTCFRRLDTDYYAWLRHKMELAKKAAGSGRLPARSFEALRTRFNVIHARAMAHLGEEALRTAIRLLDPKTYAPPRLDPVDGQPTDAPPPPKSSSPAVPAVSLPGRRRMGVHATCVAISRAQDRRDPRPSPFPRLAGGPALSEPGTIPFSLRARLRSRLLPGRRQAHRRGDPSIHRDRRSAPPGEPTALLQPGRGSTMAEENTSGS